MNNIYLTNRIKVYTHKTVEFISFCFACEIFLHFWPRKILDWLFCRDNTEAFQPRLARLLSAVITLDQMKISS